MGPDSKIQLLGFQFYEFFAAALETEGENSPWLTGGSGGTLRTSDSDGPRFDYHGFLWDQTNDSMSV